MSILWLFCVIVIVVLVCWLIDTYVLSIAPEPVRKVVRVLGVLLLCLWLLSLVFGGFPYLRIPR